MTEKIITFHLKKLIKKRKRICSCRKIIFESNIITSTALINHLVEEFIKDKIV